MLRYLIFVGGIILAMKMAEKRNRDTAFWGAISIFIPLISGLILLMLGERNSNSKDIIDTE